MRRTGGRRRVRRGAHSKKPWDRRQGETPKQFRAFAAFRDAGPDRSVMAIVRALSLRRSHVYRWARVHDWQSRAEAWDDHLDTIRQRHLEACAALGSESAAPSDLLRATALSLDSLASVVRRLLHRRPDPQVPEGVG
jgi:hypothetical protein